MLLETSGERPLQRVPPAVFKIVDVKCPDSGEGESFRLENLGSISQRDEAQVRDRLADGLRIRARVHDLQ